MNNKGSSYYRLFRLAMIIILCALILIGIVVVSVSAALYRNTRLNDLQSMGQLFERCVADEYRTAPDTCISTAGTLSRKLDSECGVKIYLFDNGGKCVITPEGSPSSVPVLDEDTRKKLDKESYLDVEKAFVSQNLPELMYGSKLIAASDSSSEAYYVIAYGTTDELDTFTMFLTMFYIIAAMAAFFGCYFLFRRRLVAHMAFEDEFLRITEQYAKGDFSEKLSSDLSDSTLHIADHVNALAAKVEMSEENSSTFIANVSHELRTPMTTIGGFVDGILDGTIKKSRQQEYLILVSQEIQRLRILITSMLNMTKFESGTMTPNFRETNLTDLVIKTVLMFEKRIEEKEINIEELDSSRLTAVVDTDLMQQVIYNLVENAVKFVDKGGTLSFTFDKRDDICIIGIRNTGEGLKDSEIQQVFDRFYKTDSSRGKDTTGLGLGLSISRKIVHLHNGHIVVKSVYGEYTEFQIQIPVDPRNADNS